MSTREGAEAAWSIKRVAACWSRGCSWVVWGNRKTEVSCRDLGVGYTWGTEEADLTCGLGWLENNWHGYMKDTPKKKTSNKPAPFELSKCQEHPYAPLSFHGSSVPVRRARCCPILPPRRPGLRAKYLLPVRSLKGWQSQDPNPDSPTMKLMLFLLCPDAPGHHLRWPWKFVALSGLETPCKGNMWKQLYVHLSKAFIQSVILLRSIWGNFICLLSILVIGWIRMSGMLPFWASLPSRRSHHT